MRKFFLSLVLITIIMICPVYADAGIALIVMLWPAFWLALIPVIFIESWSLKKSLEKERFKKIFMSAAFANFCSTLIGIPVVWGLLFGIQLLIPAGTGTFPHASSFVRYFLGVTLQAPWLLPKEADYFWMLPVACMVLLVPFFFISAWSESLIMTKFLKGNYPPEHIKKAMWKANRASYAFLYLILLGYLIYNLVRVSSSRGP